MTIGALDTNSEALANRLALQEQRSSFDLNAWIFSHFPVETGQRWLDLGCGRGKQSIPLADAGARVMAVDLSEESLDLLQGKPGIYPVHAALDDIGDRLGRAIFDRVLGSYSLYYANYPRLLFENIRTRLADGGGLFFCGPSHDNNIELRQLVADVTGRPIKPTKPAEFMESLAPDICSDLFGEVEAFTFENEVRFETAAELVTYWRSHNLFDPTFDEAFVSAAPDGFTNRKRGIGVRALIS